MLRSSFSLMFMAVEGPPMILRLYGEGRVRLPDIPQWKEVSKHFDLLPGARQICFAKTKGMTCDTFIVILIQ